MEQQKDSKKIEEEFNNKIGCKNYRAICLAFVSFKRYTKIVEGIITKFMEHKVNDEQAACRRKRRTADNICILKSSIEKMNKTNGKLSL